MRKERRSRHIDYLFVFAIFNRKDEGLCKQRDERNTTL